VEVMEGKEHAVGLVLVEVEAEANEQSSFSFSLSGRRNRAGVGLSMSAGVERDVEANWMGVGVVFLSSVGGSL